MIYQIIFYNILMQQDRLVMFEHTLTAFQRCIKWRATSRAAAPITMVPTSCHGIRGVVFRSTRSVKDHTKQLVKFLCDFLCGLVVRVPGYRSRGPWFNSRHYQIFWEVLGLERGPLNLMSTTEELLGRNSSGSSLAIREYGHRDPLRWPCDTLY
jgi:hypothetical protein